MTGDVTEQRNINLNMLLLRIKSKAFFLRIYKSHTKLSDS